MNKGQHNQDRPINLVVAREIAAGHIDDDLLFMFEVRISVHLPVSEHLPHVGAERDVGWTEDMELTTITDIMF